jgi:hypothetical protein
LAQPLIAIIDDDDEIRNALSTLMRSASYQVETFASAEAFVASDAAASSARIVHGRVHARNERVRTRQPSQVARVMRPNHPDFGTARRGSRTAGEVQRRTLPAQQTDRIRRLDPAGGEKPRDATGGHR